MNVDINELDGGGKAWKARSPSSNGANSAASTAVRR
jgi:hypothetical protein